jgi:hypothetical protein
VFKIGLVIREGREDVWFFCYVYSKTGLVMREGGGINFWFLCYGQDRSGEEERLERLQHHICGSNFVISSWLSSKDSCQVVAKWGARDISF